MSHPDPVNTRIDPALDPILAILEMCGLTATPLPPPPPVPEPRINLDLVLRTIACPN